MGTSKINILIIGTGMYVCGRGSEGYGTILPAIMQAYKSGLVGNVFIASMHGSSFELFDAKANSLKTAIGTEFPYRRYPANNSIDPRAYLDAIEDLPDPGAVIVASPDPAHFEMALAAIENGKHVLVVKPLTPTVSEVLQLISAAKEAGIYGAVEFHKRWDWANIKLGQEIERGTLGDLLYFHVEYSQRKIIPTDIFSAWSNKTNIFQYLGVHYADIIHFVTKDIPYRIIAVGHYGWLNKRGISTYDSIEVLIEWSMGFVSTILTNWIDPNCNSAMSHQMIKAVGTLGRFESDQTHRGIQIVTDLKGVEDINPYFCQPYPDQDRSCIEFRGYGIDSVTQFLKDVKSISKGAKYPENFEHIRPTFSNSLVSTAIIEGAKLSLEHDNKWIYFDNNLHPYIK
jgi:D-galacturonate reductase